MKKVLVSLFALALVCVALTGNADAKKKNPTPTPSADIDLTLPPMDFKTPEEALTFLEQCAKDQKEATKNLGKVQEKQGEKTSEVRKKELEKNSAFFDRKSEIEQQQADEKENEKIVARLNARALKIGKMVLECADKCVSYNEALKQEADSQELVSQKKNEVARQYYLAGMVVPKVAFLIQGFAPEEKKKIEVKMKELQGKLVDPATLAITSSIPTSGSPTATPVPTGSSPTATPSSGALSISVTVTPTPTTNSTSATTPSTATPNPCATLLAATLTVIPTPKVEPKVTLIPVTPVTSTPVPITPAPVPFTPVPVILTPTPLVTLKNLPPGYFGYAEDALVVPNVGHIQRFRQVIMNGTVPPKGTLPYGWGKVEVDPPMFGQVTIRFLEEPKKYTREVPGYTLYRLK